MEIVKPIIVERIVKKVVRTPKNPNYKMKCVVCGDEFLSNRKTARFCSDYCYNRFKEEHQEPIISKKPQEEQKKAVKKTNTYVSISEKVQNAIEKHDILLLSRTDFLKASCENLFDLLEEFDLKEWNKFRSKKKIKLDEWEKRANQLEKYCKDNDYV
jgi:hypothetical protein